MPIIPNKAIPQPPPQHRFEDPKRGEHAMQPPLCLAASEAIARTVTILRALPLLNLLVVVPSVAMAAEGQDGEVAGSRVAVVTGVPIVMEDLSVLEVVRTKLAFTFCPSLLLVDIRAFQTLTSPVTTKMTISLIRTVRMMVPHANNMIMVMEDTIAKTRMAPWTSRWFAGRHGSNALLPRLVRRHRSLHPFGRPRAINHLSTISQV